jgi:hypothetical protein
MATQGVALGSLHAAPSALTGHAMAYVPIPLQGNA